MNFKELSRISQRAINDSKRSSSTTRRVPDARARVFIAKRKAFDSARKTRRAGMRVSDSKNRFGIKNRRASDARARVFIAKRKAFDAVRTSRFTTRRASDARRNKRGVRAMTNREYKIAFRKFQDSLSYRVLRSKLRKSIMDTESTEDAVCAVLSSLNENSDAVQTLSALVEVLGSVIDKLQSAVQQGEEGSEDYEDYED